MNTRTDRTDNEHKDGERTQGPAMSTMTDSEHKDGQ